MFLTTPLNFYFSFIYFTEWTNTNKPSKESTISNDKIVRIIRIPTIIPTIPVAFEPFFAKRYPINKNIANAILKEREKVKILTENPEALKIKVKSLEKKIEYLVIKQLNQFKIIMFGIKKMIKIKKKMITKLVCNHLCLLYIFSF